jgi:hypothetical protein
MSKHESIRAHIKGTEVIEVYPVSLCAIKQCGGAGGIAWIFLCGEGTKLACGQEAKERQGKAMEWL